MVCVCAVDLRSKCKPGFTSLPRFLGRPDLPGDPTIDEWLSAFDVLCDRAVWLRGTSGVVIGLSRLVCEGGSVVLPG